MIVFAGQIVGGTSTNTGGQYDPVANSWTTTSTTGAGVIRYSFTSVWTGAKMVAFGGGGSGTVTNTGVLYDPAANTWTSSTTTDAPGYRYYHTSVWTGSKMITFGGNDGTNLNTGGVYTP